MVEDRKAFEQNIVLMTEDAHGFRVRHVEFNEE